MASDLSSGCTEAIEVLDEKEEGEISLEDVSSSEEGHLNYGYGTRLPQCSNCLSTQHNATWCTAPAKFYHTKGPNRREVDLILQDAVQGKENRHQIKESGCIGTKHTVSTPQEKNDDLVPISSDSDMEIVGLTDNSKQIILHPSSTSRIKKKRKKKRNHAPVMSLDDLVSSSTVDITVPECLGTLKHDMTKNNSSRSHHREMSPVRRTTRSRADPRSPPRRHRSLIRPHSPFRRSKSPVIRARSPTIRRSPRRLKSPKRSPYRSPGKTMPRKTSHPELMSSHNYIDTHKLLKKVRHLDSIGTHSLEETLNKNKEHASSLKEKLTNMMKGVCDNNSDTTNTSKEKSNTHVNKVDLNDADDEEDLALLRQKALETKQKKSNKQNEQPKTEAAKKISADIDDDQEDLELRMIALHSAVLKKHQNRVQKGMKSGKYKKSNISRSESPFTQSFLDSIPIPGEELLNFASPPHTPLPMSENNHTEDMDLDTDVEREKEKLPYSPTDKITVNIPMDTELLGIQPSDVSFISVNEANNSPGFHASMTPSQDDQKSYQGKIIENRSYLPTVAYYTPSQNALYATTNASVQYSPTDSTETVRSDFMKVHNSNVNVLKNNNSSDFVDINTSQEIPYSPTDTPVYDPDLSHALPRTLGPIATSNSSLVSMGSSCSSNIHENSEQYNHISASQQTKTTKEITNTNEYEYLDKVETLSIDPAVGSAATSLRESISPSSSMITIDDLPETDADASPLTDSLKNVKSTEYIPNNSTDNVKEIMPEPLYMKGIPDVTKDINKIPTLINRTLVPVSILKTNKQLQQPLPVRKSTAQESIFKSAEMQPVIINEEASTKTNTSFKPIKLMSLPQKSHSILTVPNAFHDSLQEESTNEIPTNKNTLLIQDNNNATLIENNGIVNTESSGRTCDITTSIQKKKKSTKKGVKRKSAGTLHLVTKEHDATGTNSDNINILDKQTNKAVKFEEFERCKHKNLGTEGNIKISNSETSKDILNQKNQISSETNEDRTKTKDTSSCDMVEQVKNTDNRRQSLDEDEEALRASLLASLPKRTKGTNQKQSNSAAATPASAVSNCNNQIFANQTVSKNIINSTNTNGTTFLSTAHANSYGSENDKNQSNSREKVSNTLTQGSLPVESVKTSALVTAGRKRLIPMIKGPQKKLMKRIPIPASTKVVNNAKKYQNAMVQRKLNLQKAALYSKQKTTESKILTKVKSNDNKWSMNTKMSPSDTPRIVINLESDTESDSESERRTKKAISSGNSLAVDKHQTTVNSSIEFQKNLDQFLQTVRKKQESLAAARPTSISQTPKKDAALMTKPDNSSNLHTPLAVRHLPASQQEEYRRLKQQIIEREKLKLHRTVESNSSVKNKNVEVSTKSVPPNSPNKQIPSKINQAISVKNQDLNAQQLNKENCSKNLDSIKNTHTNIQLCINNVHSIDKQGNTSPNQTKSVSRSMTNLNIRVSNESNPNNIGNKVVGNPLQSVTTPRKAFESSANEVLTKSKTSPGLKILSTDEVNRKYDRVVIKNDKVTLNNKTGNGNISGNRDTINKDICDLDMNQLVQSVEKEIIGNNDAVDSDASTVILTRGSQDTERKENLDTSESTIRLSQCGEESRASTISIAESKEESPLFKSNLLSNDKRSIEENWGVIKRDVKTELNTLINLSRVEQEQHLVDTEQKLVLKRYTILDELAEMSGNLRQWHMERDLQTNLVAEVRKLREQLKVAEERLQLQRNRINNIGPKVVAAHGKINAGRQECFKLATICSSLGSRIIGKEYKVPEAGAQLLDSRLKEVANHTRQLSRKKVPSIDIPEVQELTKLEEVTVSTVHSEVSQTEDLLLENSNVDNVDTTIVNENDCLTELNEVENNAPVETATVDLRETSSVQEENAASDPLSASDNVESIPQQSDIEQEVSAEQPDPSSTPAATLTVPSSKGTQELDHKKSSEDQVVRLDSTLESSNQKKDSTKPRIEHQTKKLLPYESILTHFKVPRNTNPNGILCPYELRGTCNDGDCQFVHQRDTQAK